MLSVNTLAPETEHCVNDGEDGTGRAGPGAASGRFSPSPSPKPSPEAPRPSFTSGTTLPAWISAWAKPTVASSQLTDGLQLRDFKARPLPASSARRRFGPSSNSASGDAPAAASRPAAGGPRAVSARRGASVSGDGGGAVTDGASSVYMASGGSGVDGGGSSGSSSTVSSVLLHFIRASSGPCGTMAAPPTSAAAAAGGAQARSLRTLRTSYTGGAGYGVAATAAAAATGGAGPGPASAATGAGPGLRSVGALSFNSGGGAAGGGDAGPSVAAAAARRRPMSAGPRGRPPLSGVSGAGGARDAAASCLSYSGGPPPAPSSGTGPSGFSGVASVRPSPASRSDGSLAAAAQPPPPPGTLRSRPTSAGGGGGGGGGGRRSLASSSSSSLAATIGQAVVAWGPPRPHGDRRIAAVSLEESRLGPVAEDRGYKVAASDLLLAAGAGSGGAGAGDASPPPPVPRPASLHIPPPQHMFLSGSLQELCDRLARPGDRDIHLSLGSVAFSGDLDPATGDTIRIQNRTVILHNCTIALRPGQKLYVGPGGHVILADVNVVAVAGGEAAAATAATLRAGGMTPSQRHVSDGAGLHTPRGRGAGRSSAGGSASAGVALLHAGAGGRLLLRGSCARAVLVHSATVGGGGGGADGSVVAPSPSLSYAATPISNPNRHHRTSHGSASSGGNGSGSHGLAASTPAATPPLLLAILADSGAAVEAIGCRLGRCAAAGDGTWLALRRCRVKAGSPAAAAAPLLRAADGATVEVSYTELLDGPAQGVFAGGGGTRVLLSHSAVSGCRGHGALVSPGATLTAAGCRLSGNGATGLTARGRGAAAELRESELSGNAAANLCVSGGAAASLTACGSLGSLNGCGADVDGAGSRLLAAGSAFDSNAAAGVRVRQSAVVELRDCSGSSNAASGLEVYGTVDAEDNAELLAEATLACAAPPPPPLPDVFNLVAGGQLAKNGAHGAHVRGGGGLRVTAGCELSQNGGDGACADGIGCELLLDGGCAALGNGESGLFVCSGAAVWVDGCRLGGNMHGDVAVGGRGSRGRLVGCAFDFNPMTALRVHMGAKVALRRCTMEPRPAAAPTTCRAAHRLRQLRSASAQRQRVPGAGPGGGPGAGSAGSAHAWTVNTVRSQSVQLRGQGSVLSVDGRAYFPLEEEAEGEGEGGSEGAPVPPLRELSWGLPGAATAAACAPAQSDPPPARKAEEGVGEAPAGDAGVGGDGGHGGGGGGDGAGAAVTKGGSLAGDADGVAAAAAAGEMECTDGVGGGGEAAGAGRSAGAEEAGAGVRDAGAAATAPRGPR